MEFGGTVADALRHAMLSSAGPRAAFVFGEGLRSRWPADERAVTPDRRRLGGCDDLVTKLDEVLDGSRIAVGEVDEPDSRRRARVGRPGIRPSP